MTDQDPRPSCGTLSDRRTLEHDPPPREHGDREFPRGAEPFIRLLSGRWTLAVLAELANGGCRYQDLHDSIEGIAHKVLTDTLRKAERVGLITRHLDVEDTETATLYELTPWACRSMSRWPRSTVGSKPTGSGWRRLAATGIGGPAGTVAGTAPGALREVVCPTSARIGVFSR